MRTNAPQLPGGGGMGAAGIDWCISFSDLSNLSTGKLIVDNNQPKGSQTV